VWTLVICSAAALIGAFVMSNVWNRRHAGTTSGDAAPAASSAELTNRHAVEARPQPLLKELGPTARRVNVIVLPGDANVEVDGTPYRRREGVIELTGKVGDRRQLRVVKGSQYREKEVIIQESGALPPLLDLNAPKEQRPVGPVGPAPAAKGSAAPAAPPPNPMLPEDFK
jgi:serine/threonine-protein kinase